MQTENDMDCMRCCGGKSRMDAEIEMDSVWAED